MQARNWLITENFIEHSKICDTKEFLQKLYDSSGAKYCVGQSEMGENETFHIHAYLNFEKPKKLSVLKKILPRAHFNKVFRNNGVESYVMKVETRVDGPFEFGTKPVRMNSKIDWAEVYNNAKEGLLERIPEHILFRNYNNIQRIYKDNMKVESSNHLRGIFIWGKSGLGKSTLARELFPQYTHYSKNHNKWWDSYKGEKVVIWDDITPEEGKIHGNHLKLYCDRFGIIGETKGSGIPLTYEYFIMTSQYPFHLIFEDVETRQAMERRTFIFELHDSDDFPAQFDEDECYKKLYVSQKPDVENLIIRSTKNKL